MDIATIIGLVGGFGLIIATIVMNSPLSAFIDVPSITIVLGGTVMATLIMQKLNVVLGSIKVAMNAFFLKETDPVDLIDKILNISKVLKKEGVLALENMEIENEYLKRYIRMVVDGIPGEEIVHTIDRETMSIVKRHEVGQKVFKFMASTAPSMGMIGTMIGLVTMLRSLDDPSAIGPAMAVALLTTFYGAIVAFFVCGPIAAKLEERTSAEKIVMTIIRDGVDLMIKGQSIITLEEKLNSFLAPTLRKPKD